MRQIILLIVLVGLCGLSFAQSNEIEAPVQNYKEPVFTTTDDSVDDSTVVAKPVVVARPVPIVVAQPVATTTTSKPTTTTTSKPTTTTTSKPTTTTTSKPTTTTTSKPTTTTTSKPTSTTSSKSSSSNQSGCQCGCKKQTCKCKRSGYYH